MAKRTVKIHRLDDGTYVGKNRSAEGLWHTAVFSEARYSEPPHFAARIRFYDRVIAMTFPITALLGIFGGGLTVATRHHSARAFFLFLALLVGSSVITLSSITRQLTIKLKQREHRSQWEREQGIPAHGVLVPLPDPKIAPGEVYEYEKEDPEPEPPPLASLVMWLVNWLHERFPRRT